MPPNSGNSPSPPPSSSQEQKTTTQSAKPARKQHKKKTSGKPSNDLRSLKHQQRSSSLNSLTELFPAWKEDDLLTVMDECQGDLDLAITRISEGHANQWGQVKSKRSPAAAPVMKDNNDNSSTATTITERGTLVERGTERGTVHTATRGGYNNFRGASRGGRGRYNKFGRYNNNYQPHNRYNNKEETEQEPVKAVVEPEEEAKPSWASILKGPIKLEDAAFIDQQHQQQQKDTEEQNKEETVTAPAAKEEDVVILVAKDDVEEAPNVTVEERDMVEETEDKEEEIVATDVEEDKENIAPVLEEAVKVQEPIISAPAVVRKAPVVRRLNQTEPVVLPNNQQPTLSAINVQFGSLNISSSDNSDGEDEEEDKESVVVESIEESVVAEEEEIAQKEEETIIAQKQVETPIVVQESISSSSPAKVVDTPPSPATTSMIAETKEYTPSPHINEQPNYSMNAAGLVGYSRPPPPLPLMDYYHPAAHPIHPSYYNNEMEMHNNQAVVPPTHHHHHHAHPQAYPQQQQRMGYYDPATTSTTSNNTIYSHGSPTVGGQHLFTRDKYIPPIMDHHPQYYNPYYYHPHPPPPTPQALPPHLVQHQQQQSPYYQHQLVGGGVGNYQVPPQTVPPQPATSFVNNPSKYTQQQHQLMYMSRPGSATSSSNNNFEYNQGQGQHYSNENEQPQQPQYYTKPAQMNVQHQQQHEQQAIYHYNQQAQQQPQPSYYSYNNFYNNQQQQKQQPYWHQA